jgi:hypothetical protein
MHGAIRDPTKTRARDPLTSAPAPRPVTAFENPNATMKEITATLDRRRKPWRPTSRSTARSSPTISPTNALISTNSENCVGGLAQS